MRYITDRAVQASAAAGGTIAVLAAISDAHRPLWAAIGAVWLVVTAYAVATVGRRA